MAFRCMNLLKNIKCGNLVHRYNLLSTSIAQKKVSEQRKIVTEDNLNYLGDPDTFGTLSRRPIVEDNLDDEDDVKEEQYLQNIPLKSQKLSIKQYADLIKQYLKYKRIKEAIDVLETKMLKEDRVKPENYIYNILIGACAEVGYTKKAFKLFNDMKRRALKPTGDTYTCLFESCINSPFPTYGLKMATHLRNLMIEKGIEPNLTNYNVMIKTFGRCSDLATAFRIVDEMITKKIKIRVHTFNHLLQACISDKESGLKHALVVWRKMLYMREKPNLYSFNLMLKCVKDCNLGGKENMMDIIGIIQENNILLNSNPQPLQIASPYVNSTPTNYNQTNVHKNDSSEIDIDNINKNDEEISKDSKEIIHSHFATQTNALTIINPESINIELVNHKKELTPVPARTVPNLLSKIVQIDKVLAFQDVNTVQDKFAMIGGQDDFLKEMDAYSAKPNIKTFTQMLYVIDDNVEAENKLIETMKTRKIRPDIDFYNMLIKKRCLRHDYDNALDVKQMIEKESKQRMKHTLNKKHKLSVNIMTYGVLAMACNTKEKAQQLLDEMKKNQLKVNIEILGTLLKNGTKQMKFGYVLYILDVVKQEDLTINDVLIKHLEAFNDVCLGIIQKNEREKRDSPIFIAAFKRFSNIYHNWLKDVNAEENLKPEHPWKQFMEPQPTPVQRENINIVQPKKFYKRNRKFINYRPLQ